MTPLVALANDRAGASRTLSEVTPWRWLKLYDPDRPRALDKRAQWLCDTTAPWAETALHLYQRPQKPTVRWVHKQLPAWLPVGVAAPSYDSLRRFFASMGNVALQAGRMGPRAHKSIKPFIRRDKGDLWPGEVMMADGHQFDAEVAHPRHGWPFRPEITSVLCAGTRRLLGWSIDLAESGLAVPDALRVAVMNSCLGDIFYVDRGMGYRNASRLSDWKSLKGIFDDVIRLPVSSAKGEMPAAFRPGQAVPTVPVGTQAPIAILPEDQQPIVAVVKVVTAAELIDTASDILTDEARTPTLSPADIEVIVLDVLEVVQSAIDANRNLYPVEQARRITEPLKNAALAIQEAAAVIIDARAPLRQRVVMAPTNLHLLAHAWYGDYRRAGELLRLNSNVRNPNDIDVADAINGYSQ